MGDVLKFEPPPQRTKMAPHNWVPMNLGHSTHWCSRCKCTPKEAQFALGPNCPTS